MYFRFFGELDEGFPLKVIFHLPSETISALRIQSVSLSYIRDPFRATSKAAVASSPAINSTSASNSATTHTHNLFSTQANVFGSNRIFWKASTQTWSVANAIIGFQFFINVTTEGEPAHLHTWTLTGHNGQPIAGVDSRLVAVGGRLAWTGSSIPAPIILNIAGDPGHGHIVNISPSGGQDVFFIGGALFAALGTGTSILVSTEAENPHSHLVSLPAHPHDVEFGIFEESNAVAIGVKRSDDGVNFEATDFTTSTTVSGLNIDMDFDSFYSEGSGSGFKAIQLIASGVPLNESRTAINGMIQVKVDIDA